MGMEADIPHNPVVVSNYLFLSWYQNGIQIFDITDRTKPVKLGFYDTYPGAESSSFQGNWGVFPYLGFDKILISDIQSGLFVMDATAVLTPTNNYPPLILSQPSSTTVNQGASVTFSPVVTGSNLRFQWQFNGADIPASTNASLVITNVQPANAGSYSFIVSNVSAQVTSAPASLSVVFPQTFQTVFYEPFDSPGTATNWNIFDGSANGISDYTVNWAYDYGTYFSVYNNAPIPPAPGTTNGTTRGVRLTVNNNDATGATAGVSLYPKGKSFSGPYRMTCDMWINYPGTAGGAGSTGSTEHGTFGINHSGTRVNWGSTTATASDGTWFAVDGEGGTSVDYRAYIGNIFGNPGLLSFAGGGLAASGAGSADNADSHWQSLFPSPDYESAGAPGKHWVQVEVSQDPNNIITWRMNGNLIAQRPNPSSFTNGDIMIGYMDLFTSIASPAADAFILFDNVRVELAVPIIAPSITGQPQNQNLFPGQDASFSVAATGSAPLSFQWLFNGAIIPGAISNSFTRPEIQAQDVGFYSVVISNAAGVITSTNALLTLQDSPYLGAVQATPGARSALISWNTTVPSDSLVQYEIAPVILPGGAAAAGGFASSSYVDLSPTTNHVILLTGLQPGTRYSYQVISTAGTNHYVSGVYQFSTAGSLIVDNTSAAISGTWTTSSVPDQYSNDYLSIASVSGAPTATVTFRPNIVTPGLYNIYAWYPSGAGQAPNVPFAIAFNGGATTASVNEQSDGGSWQSLAQSLPFARGTNGYVQVANNAALGNVAADAVRFEYIESQDFPTGQSAPTWWQDFYFGGPVDLSADPDQDSYATAQEYVLGTSPTNTASHLQLAAQSAGPSVNISFWPLLSDRAYQLLYRPELGLPAWQSVPLTNISAQPDGQGVVSLNISNAPQNFYRLKVQLTTHAAFSGALPAIKTFSPYASDPLCSPNRAYIQ
jgi:hypothetical protein